MVNKKYGVVYTPSALSDFVAQLVYRTVKGKTVNVVLDPASGECSLLKATKKFFGNECEYIGIDVDKDAVDNTKIDFHILNCDAVMPSEKISTAEYWRRQIPNIDVIIANPPWSSEKIYSRKALSDAGFTLASKQYDSYVLFMELSYNILTENGIMAFIIPDSIFDTQNDTLRKFLVERTQIKIIARLGEKIFEGVNRATAVIVCQKTNPAEQSQTICFRLSTDDRRKFLSGGDNLAAFFDKQCHTVMQSRFLNNDGYNFDIDVRRDDESLIHKLQSNSINMNTIFTFGRGVEISKNGAVVICPHCKYAQGYKKQQLKNGWKICTNCENVITVDDEHISNIITDLPYENTKSIFVGEDLHRYKIDNKWYIKTEVKGINYKEEAIYNIPKLLVRKTGLGIYAAVDYSHSLTSQTIYILRYTNRRNKTPLEYYLALINSRVVYYYYLKTYGENEWKSHPYLTKKILFSLPIMEYTDSLLDREIIAYAKKISSEYDILIDLKLEELIMDKYSLTADERTLVAREMNGLPDLGAINGMKMEC